MAVCKYWGLVVIFIISGSNEFFISTKTWHMIITSLQVEFMWSVSAKRSFISNSHLASLRDSSISILTLEKLFFHASRILTQLSTVSFSCEGFSKSDSWIDFTTLSLIRFDIMRIKPCILASVQKHFERSQILLREVATPGIVSMSFSKSSVEAITSSEISMVPKNFTWSSESFNNSRVRFISSQSRITSSTFAVSKICTDLSKAGRVKSSIRPLRSFSLCLQKPICAFGYSMWGTSFKDSIVGRHSKASWIVFVQNIQESFNCWTIPSCWTNSSSLKGILNISGIFGIGNLFLDVWQIEIFSKNFNSDISYLFPLGLRCDARITAGSWSRSITSKYLYI